MVCTTSSLAVFATSGSTETTTDYRTKCNNETSCFGTGVCRDFINQEVLGGERAEDQESERKGLFRSRAKRRSGLRQQPRLKRQHRLPRAVVFRQVTHISQAYSRGSNRWCQRQCFRVRRGRRPTSYREAYSGDTNHRCWSSADDARIRSIW